MELQSWLMNKYGATHVEIYIFDKTTKTYRSRDETLPIFHTDDQPVHMIRECPDEVLDLSQARDDLKAAEYFKHRHIDLILPLNDSQDGLLGWIGFASHAIHAEDLVRLNHHLAPITSKFQLILQYEDAVMLAKRDGMLPKHL
jgi:hypothetical protein